MSELAAADEDTIMKLIAAKRAQNEAKRAKQNAISAEIVSRHEVRRKEVIPEAVKPNAVAARASWPMRPNVNPDPQDAFRTMGHGLQHNSVILGECFGSKYACVYCYEKFTKWGRCKKHYTAYHAELGNVAENVSLPPAELAWGYHYATSPQAPPMASEEHADPDPGLAAYMESLAVAAAAVSRHHGYVESLDGGGEAERPPQPQPVLPEMHLEPPPQPAKPSHTFYSYDSYYNYYYAEDTLPPPPPHLTAAAATVPVLPPQPDAIRTAPMGPQTPSAHSSSSRDQQLTAATLASLGEGEQREALGERLYPRVTAALQTIFVMEEADEEEQDDDEGRRDGQEPWRTSRELSSVQLAPKITGMLLQARDAGNLLALLESEQHHRLLEAVAEAKRQLLASV